MSIKMLHTCIRVMDLEKSLEFYKNALGLVETRRKDFPEHKFTLVYLSDVPGGYEVDLTYNYNPEVTYDVGNGCSHIAIAHDNIESLREKHSEMGYEVTDLKGLPGEKPHYYFVTDPDGYKVEVIRG